MVLRGDFGGYALGSGAPKLAPSAPPAAQRPAIIVKIMNKTMTMTEPGIADRRLPCRLLTDQFDAAVLRPALRSIVGVDRFLRAHTGRREP